MSLVQRSSDMLNPYKHKCFSQLVTVTNKNPLNPAGALNSKKPTTTTTTTTTTATQPPPYTPYKKKTTGGVYARAQSSHKTLCSKSQKSSNPSTQNPKPDKVHLLGCTMDMPMLHRRAGSTRKLRKYSLLGPSRSCRKLTISST